MGPASLNGAAATGNAGLRPVGRSCCFTDRAPIPAIPYTVRHLPDIIGKLPQRQIDAIFQYCGINRFSAFVRWNREGCLAPCGCAWERKLPLCWLHTSTHRKAVNLAIARSAADRHIVSAMADFWRHSGYRLLRTREDGRRVVTDYFLRAYIERPDMRLVGIRGVNGGRAPAAIAGFAA